MLLPRLGEYRVRVSLAGGAADGVLPFTKRVLGACDRGTYTEQIGSVGCEPCPAGGYCPEAGAASRLVFRACQVGTYNEATGASSNTSCIPCPAGTASPNPNMQTAAACRPCDAGYFSSEPGTGACERCAPGFYADKPGATACVHCARGWRSDPIAIPLMHFGRRR